MCFVGPRERKRMEQIRDGLHLQAITISGTAAHDERMSCVLCTMCVSVNEAANYRTGHQMSRAIGKRD